MTKPTQIPPDRSHVETEKRNPRSRRMHALDVASCVALIQSEDRQVLLALKRAATRLTRFIEAAEPGFVAGGRLIYVGAGTSGRLGVLDASEAPPTFCVPPSRVVGIIAGGDRALRQSSEGLEDDSRGAWPELDALDLTSDDAVIAIAAGGTTPYAIGVFAYCARRSGEQRPLTSLLCCSPPASVPEGCDHVITLKTGPEVLTGSTRMKAGSATKMALNTISTTLMTRAGKVYDNLMVDVRATNDKLRDRASRIVTQVAGVDRERALHVLDACDGHAKRAIVVAMLSCTPDDAARMLIDPEGRLGDVIDGVRKERS